MQYRPDVLGKQKTPKAPPKSYLKTPQKKFSDLAGIDAVVEELQKAVQRPLRFPALYHRLDIKPEKGFLFHGPSGCGKTILAEAVAAEYGLSFVSFSGQEIVTKVSGDTERQLRHVFDEAVGNAPSLVFVDNLDSLAPSDVHSPGEIERRAVAQLGACMDRLSPEDRVVVVGAVGRPENIDQSLRRPGRFGKEILLPIPDKNARKRILQHLLRATAKALDTEEMAQKTPGYSGADLEALVAEMRAQTLDRILLPGVTEKELLARDDLLAPSENDIACALKKIMPTAQREGFAAVPEVTWRDIGALEEIRATLKKLVVDPIRHSEIFHRTGTSTPKGVLLWGPPGCGKTMLAKAVANESRTNFISVKGPEI
ncbi:MAG: Cdc48-like AAA ATPase, partial [Amphiamblys sp. WSBS2006]